MSEQFDSIFPLHTGTEEEIRGFIYSPGIKDIPSTFEPVRSEITEKIHEFAGTLAETEMLENGGRVYYDMYGPEICCPECSDPRTHTKYIYAGAELLKCGLGAYLKELAQEKQRHYVAVLDRRVIDDKGVTWACHDNFSISSRAEYYHAIDNTPEGLGKLWYGFLRSRSFITGAGMVGSDTLHYSQKLTATTKLVDHGYKPRMLSVKREPELRLEIGCSDVNLKEWSCLARIGGAALFLAATQTHLAQELLKTPEFQHAGWGHFTNIIDIQNEDMQFKPTAATRYLIDVQRRIISTILKDLETATGKPMPPVLKMIAQAQLDYCDDFEAVLNGTKDLGVLTTRADWAQKVFALRRDITEDRVKGKKRSLYDDRAKDIDTAYGRTVLKADTEGNVTRIEGYGTRKAAIHSTIPAEEIKEAMHTPPPGTRAATRVEVAKGLGNSLRGCSWNTVEIDVGQGTYVSQPINFGSAA